MPFSMGQNPTEELSPLPQPLTVDFTREQEKAAPLPAALKRHDVAVTAESFQMPCINEKAWEFCKAISHSSLLPANLRSTKDHDTTGDLYLMLETARSLEMNFIQAINGLYCLPDARPAMYVSTMRALVLRAGGVFTVEEFDEQKQVAICTVLRNGVPYTGKFSVQDAINRGKMIVNANGIAEGTVSRNGKPSPWRQDYRNMCAVRACGRACQKGFADVLMGLSSAEEVRDLIEVPALDMPSVPRVLPPTSNNNQAALQAALLPNDNQ